MNPAELRASTTPPQGKSAPLTALWHAAKGEWDKAHALVQNEESTAAAWVHAHLHRVEGDDSNAGYWYRRAGKPHAKSSLDDEWDAIASTFLDEGPL